MRYHSIALALVLCCPAAGPLLAQAATPTEADVSPTADDYEALLGAAREHERAGRHEQAIAAYSRLLARQPDNADVLLARGRVHAWMGRWPEAEADLTSAVAAAPEYADAWSVLGNMYLWSGRPAKATEAYGRWAQLRPEDPAPRLAQARALLAVEDPAAAETKSELAGTAGAEAGQTETAPHSNPSWRRASGITVPEGYRWTASLLAQRTTFSRDRDGWYDHVLSLRRHFEGGSLAVELLDARRFGRDDRAWALDGYAELWNRAYANVRYQHASQGSLFPEWAWRVELFQGFGRGWEVSASHDMLGFEPAAIRMQGLGLGRYIGNFYLQGRTLRITGDGSSGVSHRGLFRYYYAGQGDDYIEVSAGSGRSGEELARTGGNAGLDRTSVGAAFVRFWNPRWGIKVGTEYAEEHGRAERLLAATLYRRW